MSISSLLCTARDSLLAHQTSMGVTGSNVANVDTPGYTRQRVVLKSVASVNSKGSDSQIGVCIDRIERIYDRYINSQITTQQQNTGFSDTLLQGLQTIEVMMDDTNGGGINDQLKKFWAAWEDLSKNSGGIVERTSLLTATETLTNTLATYKQSLDTFNSDMNSNIAGVISQINDKAEEIADLNEKIIGMAGNDGAYNDLMDKRTEALKELGGLVNINQFETESGAVNVYLANGEPLVQDATSRILSVDIDLDGRTNVYAENASDEPLNGLLTKGKLGAFIELQDTVIPQYVDDLNSFATALSNRVNELHSSGFDAYQNTGADFFIIANANNAAGSIEVNSAIAADVNRIAASTTISGDGNNASAIATVQNELLMTGNTSTLSGFLASMVGQIGDQVANAKTDSDRQSAIMNNLNNQRDSISGVSIDEEMINLMKYQLGYTAAGKLITTVNSMLDTLMGLIK